MHSIHPREAPLRHGYSVFASSPIPSKTAFAACPIELIHTKSSLKATSELSISEEFRKEVDEGYIYLLHKVVEEKWKAREG